MNVAKSQHGSSPHAGRWLTMREQIAADCRLKMNTHAARLALIRARHRRWLAEQEAADREALPAADDTERDLSDRQDAAVMGAEEWQ
ncbi:MAG: hypothetical protein ABII76_27390 [Pseudomonadota bacterium]